MKAIYYLFGMLLLTVSCENKDLMDPLIAESAINDTISDSIVDNELSGTWAIVKIYSNDHWGGSCTWTDATYNKQVKFTTDFKYYVNKDSVFELIGTYKKIDKVQLEITLAKPLQPEYPTYIQLYTLFDNGELELPTGTNEGIVLERFKLFEK